MHRNHFKKSIPLFLIVMILSVFSAALWGQNLEIHYINVQQGQSTLIIGPNGTTILFDGGYENKGTTEVVPYLQSIGIPATQVLDYIISSHLDTDHFVGLTEAITYGYDALHVYYNGSAKTNTYVESFMAAAATTTAGGAVTLPLGTVIDLGYGATATCVAANGSVVDIGAISGATDENDRAICLLIKYNGFDFLLNGDMGGGAADNACTGRSTSQSNMESPTVMAIMPAGIHPLLSQYGVEVAHVGHHGSESSTNADYMNILTPRVACISVGAGQDASYMHPRKDVVEHVLLKGVSCITAPAALVLQTEEGSPIGTNTSTAGNSVGDIVITTDGINSYTVNANGVVSQGPDERTTAGLPVTYYFEEYSAADNAPIIYNVHSENITTTAADIIWSTNETSSSVVRYGTSTGSYTDTTSSASLVLNHQLSLSGLTPFTTYYYVVDSTDETTHTTTSVEYSFQTTGVVGGGVVFSEVYYDTIGNDAVEEWIELYNNSATTADISGWQITDNNNLGATYTIPAGKTMAPNSYYTIAVNSAGFIALYGRDADLYGAIPSLNNGGDALVLKNSSGVVQDAVGWEVGATGGLPVGWGSTSLPNAPTGSTIVRSNVTTDTDTYIDWTTAASNGNPQTQPVVVSTITVTSPNGGESWNIGTSYNITWTSTGTVGSLNIDYSTNNGTGWTSVATGEANDGIFSWTIPSITPSTTCLVRVQEADAIPTDTSNAVFAIAMSSPASGVIISEVYYDTIGTDAIEEWVELYNTSTAAADIGGWTITDNYPAGGHVTIPAGTMIAPHSYLTVAANSVGFNNLYGYDADYYYGTAIALGNSGDALLLRDGLGSLVDAVSYEGGSSGGLPTGWGSTTMPRASTGSTIVRSDVTTDTNTYADWTTAANNGFPQTQLKVVFSEVYYDTIGTDAIEEWIELYNNSGKIVDIGNCTITDNYPAGGHVTIPAGTKMAPYSYLTVAANSAGFTNLYGYEADYYYGTAIALGNGGDALLLRDSLGNLVDAVSYEGGSSGGLPTGWGSTTMPRASTGSTIVRTDVTVDTHTYADWSTAANNGHPQTQRRYTLTIVAGEGGTTNPVAGTYTYYEGDTVEIEATASTGYRFDNWSDDASGSTNPVGVLMNGNKTVTANFMRQYTLTIATGEGGTTNPVPGTYSYDTGTVVAIECVALAGYRFSNWTGDASGEVNPTNVTMDGDKTVTANFIRQYTLTIAVREGGTTNPRPGTYTYDVGTRVNVVASTLVGYRFANWSGNASGTSTSIMIMMDGNKRVTAHFIQGYTLAISAGVGGTTNLAPGIYTYDSGTSVSLQALPAAGYEFATWSGDASGSANPVTIVMDGNKTIQASFTQVVKPPLALSGVKLVNRSVSMREYVVRLNWQSNPANTGTINYRIYRIENGQAQAIADVGVGINEYIIHDGIQKSTGYLFGVTAINSQGWESGMVTIAVQ